MNIRAQLKILMEKPVVTQEASYKLKLVPSLNNVDLYFVNNIANNVLIQ